MRLIDADAFERHCMFDENINDMQDVIYALRDYPTIDAEPVKHGHWIKTASPYHFKCSSCKVIANIKYHSVEDHKYCWYCGARMDEKLEGKSADACFIDEPGNPRYV